MEGRQSFAVAKGGRWAKLISEILERIPADRKKTTEDVLESIDKLIPSLRKLKTKEANNYLKASKAFRKGLKKKLRDEAVLSIRPGKKLRGRSDRRLKNRERRTIAEEFDIETDTPLQLKDFFRNLRERLRSIVASKLADPSFSLKVKIIIVANFEKETAEEGEEPEQTQQSFSSPFLVLHSPSNFVSVFLSVVRNLTSQVEGGEMIWRSSDGTVVAFQSGGMVGSGWIFQGIERGKIKIVTFRPLRGGTFVPTPDWLRKRKALLNFETKDEKCLLWCLARAILGYRRKNGERIKDLGRITKEMKKKVGSFETRGISFPLSIKSIGDFAKLNPSLPPINIYGVFGKEIAPLSISESKPGVDPVSFLLLSEKDKSHFVLIRNLSRLVGAQHTKGQFVCPRCLYYMPRKSKDQHLEFCLRRDPCLPVFKDQKEKLAFKNEERRFEHPLVFYADTEAILFPKDEKKGNKTVIVQEHHPCAWGILPVSRVGTKTEYFQAIAKDEDDDVILNCLQKAKDLATDFVLNGPAHKKLRMTKEDEALFRQQEKCFFCGGKWAKKFDQEGKLNKFFRGEKVRDHCHYTGKFRGAAHSLCNLNHREQTTFNFYCHNMQFYDSHFFIPRMRKVFSDVSCIANNSEQFKMVKGQFIVFTEDVEGNEVRKVCSLRLLDTTHFLKDSLEKLALQLTKRKSYSDPIKFVHPLLPLHFGQDVDTFCRKSFFPYDWFDSFEKLNFSSLPPKEDFFSLMKKKGISQEDYDFAKNVFEKHCHSFKDYLLLYQKIDVVLLAAIFENFRDTSLSHFGLDPCHYVTGPSMFFDSLLFKSFKGKEGISFVKDAEDLEFWEKAKRGGVTLVPTRYACREEGEILYFDANGLYASCFLLPLPIETGLWMTPFELENWETFYSETRGVLLEVDLSFPPSLHDFFNDFPPAPELITPPKGKAPKLIPHLGKRKHYVVYAKLLSFYLSLGVVIDKIHRGKKFRLERFAAAYAQEGSDKRKTAKKEGDLIADTFFKLSLNAPYGKFIEDVRKYSDIKFYDKNYAITKSIAKPTFKDLHIIDEDLALIEFNKTKVMFSKPIQVGVIILEEAKLRIYQFHYMMKKKFPNNLRLLMTDTDSLVYQLFGEKDIFSFFSNEEFDQHFDLSSLPKDNKYFSSKNTKVPGMMKVEYGDKTIEEFIGLRPKAYHISFSDSKEREIKAKGVPKEAAKRDLTRDAFFNTLFENQEKSVKFRRIGSFQQKLITTEASKIALSSRDNKVFVRDDNIRSFAWGHHKITSEEAKSWLEETNSR